MAETLSVRRRAREGFLARLAAMTRDQQIRSDAQGRLQLLPESRFIAGRVQGHREGYGFLVRDDGEPDLFLSSAQMQKVMHNDRARARLVGYDRRRRPEGHIVEVIERANTHLTGCLICKEEGIWLVPSEQRIGQEILIEPRGRRKARAGQIVSVELIRFPDRYTPALGRIVEVLGECGDPGIEIEIAVRKFGIPHQFSEAARAQAAQLPDAPVAADLRGRVDMRHLPWVTIDGEDARDFDDAVYGAAVKLGRRRGFRLMVAIADVSYYVKPGDALDTAALERSTSVYFPRRVIPMLPPELSTGLCSLNPNVDRCALVCDLVIDAQGALHTYQFYPAMIHSIARLTYTEVAALLSELSAADARSRPAFFPQLQTLHRIYQALARARARRGAIDFDVVETAMICNAEGKIERILPRVRNEAHQLIEECMLAANVCAADLLQRHQHPCLYRVHAGPSEEKLASLRRFLGGVGLTLGGGEKPQARDYAALIAQVRARPDAQMLQTMLLRSLQQAAYSPDNIGHFGLAYSAYTHFTSPIRRYPDLLVHRALRAILNGRQYRPRKSDVLRHLPASSLRAKTSVWQTLGLHCSANERRVDEATRDVEAWLKCHFMLDKRGEIYEGMVSGVTSFGLFVTLDTLFVEGLVHISTLGSGYLEYDEIKNELRAHTGARYGLSDRLRVQVSRVDPDARKIDFLLVERLPMPARAHSRIEAPSNSSTSSAKKSRARKKSVCTE